LEIDAIKIKQEDNVATALSTLKKNDKAKYRDGDSQTEILILEDIPYGHKFATKDIAIGEEIIKYGEVIGRATSDIKAGSHTHTQNLESLRGRGDLGKA
jgi:altronate dehydratase small subunit